MASLMHGQRKGRGAAHNPDNRFAEWQREAVNDGWSDGDPEQAQERTAPLPTELLVDHAKTVIARNTSPDVPHDRSINPYRGCEHGCSYCFARPTHAYLGLSPGLDFETRIAYKPDAALVLRRELARRDYVCKPLALGINTDAYQPVERRLRITRQILEVLAECRHPVSIVTKSALVLRDLDLLVPMARDGLAHVAVSVTTLDVELCRQMEPRAASPARRLAVLRALADAGVPVAVLVAPLIPALTDHELERILTAAAEAGAGAAGYILLRLPHEVKPLFRDWLERHQPGRAEHVFSLLRQMHGGKTYDSRFGQRQHGSGPFAEVIAQRFKTIQRRLGLDQPMPAFECSLFQAPSNAMQSSPGNGQMTLF